MIIAAYLLDPIPSMICITIAVGLGAFAWSGFAVNHLDVAPQYASVLMGIGNTFATIPGIVSPTLTGLLVKDGGVSFCAFLNLNFQFSRFVEFFSLQNNGESCSTSALAFISSAAWFTGCGRAVKCNLGQ